MTKIAYLRASQQNPGLHFPPSTPPSPIKSPSHMAQNRVFFQPPMPGAAPVLGAFNPHPPVARASNSAPKPLMMAPTTRFNSNPTVAFDDQSGPGGRISKPLMEKRRRARINQCLSQLKQIVVDSAGQYTENNKCKLEKADILELTVKYVKKLHADVSSPSSATPTSTDPLAQSTAGYVTGYSDCVRSIVDFISELPELSEAQRDTVQAHLNQCLYSVQSGTQNSGPIGTQAASTTFCTPPSPAPSAESNLSGSSSPSLSPSLTVAVQGEIQSRAVKREFSDSDSYDDSDGDGDYDFDSCGPINLSKMPKLGANGDTWRPW